MKWILCGLALMLMVGNGANSCKTELDHKEQAEALAKRNLNFVIDYYKALAEQNVGKNIFFSPFSIFVAMVMVNVGARSESRKEIIDALKLGDNMDDTNVAVLDILNSLNPKEGCGNFTLRTANRMYVEQTYGVLEEFQKTLKQYYLTEAVKADFLNAAENWRLNINKWVEDVTNGKITNLIPKDTVDSLTKLILVNAIYFKGNWKDRFDPEFTEHGKFFKDTQTTVNAMFMNSRGEYGYSESQELNCKILKLPFEGDRLSMYAILPNDVNGLATLEMQLTATNLKSLIDSSQNNKTVIVKLPKFQMNIFSEINDILKKLGMKRIFDKGQSDLTGISSMNDLYVSKVLHKAYIIVNEEGTEAAAATDVIILEMGYESRQNDPAFKFIADHPFICVIHDRITNMVLFKGRVIDPSSSQ